MKNFIAKNQDFFKPIFTIALPIAFQNMIGASLNMIDTLLIGQLGQVAIAAVGLANQYFFLLNLFLFGVNSGAAIFVAQFWGQRDVTNIRRVLGIGLITSIVVSAVFTFIALFFPQHVMKVFTNDPAVISRGIEYLRIVSVSYIFTAISFTFALVLRSTGKVTLPVKVTSVALVVNTIFNYLLIYGKWGFPRMEARGSALGTVIARTVELAAFLLIIYGKKLVPAAKIKELTDFNIIFAKRFFKTIIPVILNESLWALGVTMFTVVYAHMGTEVVAGVNIFSTIERMSFVLFMGLAQACAVTVGHDIGANQESKAFNRAKQYSLFGPVLSLIIGWGMVMLSGSILSLFNVSVVTSGIARQILIIFAFLLPIKVFNLINIVGILRSGGDTRFSLFIDVGFLWAVAVPISFLAGLVWRLPAPFVYLLAALEEVFKFFFGINRMLSRKWIHNLTHSLRSAVNETQV